MSRRSLKPIVDEEDDSDSEHHSTDERKEDAPSVEVLYAAQETEEEERQDVQSTLEDSQESQSDFSIDLNDEEYRKYVSKVLEDGNEASRQLEPEQEDEDEVHWADNFSNDDEETDSDEYQSSGGTWSYSDESSEGNSRSVDEKSDSNNDGFVEEAEESKPLMGMKSFRYFEARVLAGFLKETDDEKMNALRERFNKLKKVKAPGSSSNNSSLSFIKRPSSMENDAGDDEGQEDEGMMEKFTDKQWALKNAEMFLKSAGCQSPVQSDSNIRVKLEDQTAKLQVFQQADGLGERRRDGVGSKDGAPEITPALKRQAERAMWRSIIDNSKPKYPLPRFILLRHKFLRKVESELIGPGSYEHDYFEMQREKRMASMPSMFRSCSSRFPKEKWRAPGADFIADPYEKWDAACKKYKHPGRGVPFESTPCNFRYKDFYVGCGIPPNAYNIKSPLEEFLNKNKFSKGLYDLPSEGDSLCPKDKGAHSASKLGPGAYEVRESVVKNLTDSYHCFKGKFSKTERRKMYGFKAAFENPLWPKDNGGPGPDTYSPYEHEEWIEPAWAPFGNQGPARVMDLRIQAKMLTSDYYHYGDGTTLDKGWVPEIFGGGVASNFLSKSPQITPETKHSIFKERNQALNHTLYQDRVQRSPGTDEC